MAVVEDIIFSVLSYAIRNSTSTHETDPVTGHELSLRVSKTPPRGVSVSIISYEFIQPEARLDFEGELDYTTAMVSVTYSLNGKHFTARYHGSFDEILQKLHPLTNRAFTL